MRKYNTLIFDWDGTLHNTGLVYIEAFRKAFAYLVESGNAAERYLSDEEITKYLGMTATDMWEDFMPELPMEERSKCGAMVGKYMIADILDGKAKLYDGVPDVLRELKNSGYRLVILSNCNSSYMDISRECFGLDEYFDAYYVAGDYENRPKYEIFKHIEQNDRFDGDYIMIGDRYSDMAVAAENPDVLGIGCAYGFGKISEYEEACKVVNDVRELPNVIEDINAGKVSAGVLPGEPERN